MTMRSITTIFTMIITVTLFLSSSYFVPTNSTHHQFSRSLSKKDQTRLGLTTTIRKPQKLSHLRFFFHDIVSGRNPTAVRVAEAPGTNSSATGFGAVVVIDNPLTLGPETSSKIVGRAQGVYTLADQKEFGLLMAFNFVFTAGKFNGSTLSVLGRNEVMVHLREMPVVGGSGVLRFARGYAEATTHQFDPKTRDAVVEYNVYVFHY